MFRASEKLGKPLLIGSMGLAFLIMANKKVFAQEIQDSRIHITESIKEEKDTASLGKIEGFDANDENNDMRVTSYFKEHFPGIYVACFDSKTGIVTGVNELVLVDMETGEIKWMTHYVREEFDNISFSTLTNGFLCTGHKIYKIEMKTGELKQINACKRLSENLGYYTFINDTGLVISTSYSDKLKVAQLDIETGEIKWIQNLENSKMLEVIGFGQNILYGLGEDAKIVDWNTGEIVFLKNDYFTEEQNKELDNLGIDNHKRFDGEMADHVIKNRKLLQGGKIDELQKKPIVVMMFAAADSNQVFTRQNIEGFKEKYNVLYYEVGHEDSLYKYLNELESLKEKIDMLFIGAHSGQSSMSLGDIGSELIENCLAEKKEILYKQNEILEKLVEVEEKLNEILEKQVEIEEKLNENLKEQKEDYEKENEILEELKELYKGQKDILGKRKEDYKKKNEVSLREQQENLEKLDEILKELEEDYENQKIDFSDEKELGKYSDLFINTKVILLGCSAGKGKDKEDNVANFLSRSLCSKSQEIYSSTVNMGNYFLFDKEGNFIKANFLDPIYYSKYKELFNEDQIYITKGKHYKE